MTPHVPRRAALSAAAAAAALLCAPRRAPAQTAAAWRPTRPIRLIVPFPAGGSADVSARLVADRLRADLGGDAAVVVENRTGAGGNIAAAEAARAEPDGHALFVGTSGTQAINGSLYARLPYDPDRDFRPVAFLWDAPNLLVVHPALPARDVAGLVALSRARPAGLTYGSSGVGSTTHLAGELLRGLTGAALTHVPYRGQGPALADLVAGRLDLMLPLVPDSAAQVASGGVRALAVAAPARSAVLPEVPTAAEAGLPDFLADTWTAVFAPSRTPDAAVARLREALVPYVGGDDFAARMRALGIVVRPETPEALEARVAADRARWSRVIADLGLRLE